MTVKVFDTWQENVWIDTHLAAIRWKANLRKDRKHIRSSHSEDRLTWIVYRALEGENLVPQFCREVLGLPPTDRVWVYYWQRLPNSERIDQDIDAALAEVEPCHTAQGAPRTETDLLLLRRLHPPRRAPRLQGRPAFRAAGGVLRPIDRPSAR